MAIWRLTAKRDMARGRITKGQSANITTIGSGKPQASHVQKAFDTGSYSISATNNNFIIERID